MFGHRHLLRQCARPKVLRSFSSTSRVDPPAQTERGSEEKGEGEWSAPKDPTWAVWKKTIGKQFEEPRRPCNWLGGKVVEFVSVWQRSRIRFLLLNPVRLSALPVKPILQTANPSFGRTPKYTIPVLHGQSGGQLGPKPCQSVSFEHQTRGRHSTAERSRGELDKGLSPPA
jgi:hypothetical protein